MIDTPTQAVSEDELHAFVDGQLPAARQEAVRAWLAAHPETAREIESWRENDAALGALLDGFHYAAQSDIPPLRKRGGMDGRAVIVAALLLAFGLGGTAGYLTHGVLASPGTESAWLEQAARDVHLTYVREVRHPVEVGADDYDHLITWLGNRIEKPFSAPGLENLGFNLMGGRLVPIGGRPGAMLMYENAQGDRATILLARNTGARDTAFQFSDRDGVNTFRWIDGPLAYAISGFLDRGALEAVSRAVYDHFETI